MSARQPLRDARPEPRIRPLRRAEAPRVGALTLAAYDRYGEITGRYRDFLGDPTQRLSGCRAVLVATLPTGGASGQDEIVGTVSYVTPGDAEWEHPDPPPGDAGFRILAVDPAWEGGGIGAALVAACVRQAREEGRHRMLLTSMSWMTRAHTLYEGRFGFRRRPDLARRFPSGIGWVYALDLTDEAPRRFPPPGPAPAEPPWFLDVPRR